MASRVLALRDGPAGFANSLQSSKPGVRAAALLEIARLGEDGALRHGTDHQVLPLLDDPEAMVQEHAVRALGSLGARGGQHSAQIAAKLAGGHKRVRRAAFAALTQLGPFAAQHADAVEHYLDDRDADFVADAALALGALGAVQSAGKLAQKLSSADGEVVRAAVQGLAMLDTQVDAIAKLLNHQEAPTRAAAVTALGTSSKAAEYVAQVAPLVGDKDAFVRIAAAELVARRGSAAAAQVPTFGQLLSSEHPGVVAAACHALSGLGQAAHSEVLQLEKALQLHGEDKATLPFSAAGCARKVPAELRKPAAAAAHALAAVGAHKSAARVADLLNSKDWEVRVAALEALGSMGSEGSKFETSISDLLADSMPAVVAAAALALGQLARSTTATSATAQAVAEKLEDAHPGVREAACRSLAMMAEEAQPFLEQLVKLFGDKSWRVQQAAVEAVASCGELGQMYAAHVCRLIFEGHQNTKLSALKALASMGERGAAFQEEWESLLDDQDPEIARAAREALQSFAAPPLAPVESKALPPPPPSSAAPVVDRSKLPVGLLFPGQGSQYVKMLEGVKDLPSVKSLTDKAREILGYDLLQLCLEGPEDKLEQTKFCQPAMYVGGLAAVEHLKQDKPELVQNCRAVAGLSLGEYTALTVAGVFDFETGLKLVQLRGEAMQEAAEATPQMMVSVAGLDQPTLERLCKESLSGPTDICQVANFLFPSGFSCAGSKAAVEKLMEKATATQGCLQAKPLKTSGAFHTEFMGPARQKLLQALKDCEGKMSAPRCDVYMNVTGQRLAAGTPPAEIVAMLGDQLCSCVLWEPAMRNMIKDGIEEFYECGPMKQLKAMMKRIDQKAWGKTTNVHV